VAFNCAVLLHAAPHFSDPEGMDSRENLGLMDATGHSGCLDHAIALSAHFIVLILLIC